METTGLIAVPDPLPQPPHGEAGLVARLKAGDEAAMRTLIALHNRRLFRVARAVLRDEADAEDVVQETYVRAFAGLERFRGESGLATWLTRIALNEALGRLRRRRPTTDIEALDTEVGGSLIPFPAMPRQVSPESETARTEIRLVLERAIDALPDPFRLVLVLRDVEGLSTEETAAHLAIRTETVKTRLHRARKQVRTAVERALSSSFAELFPFGGTRCAKLADRVVGAVRAFG